MYRDRRRIDNRIREEKGEEGNEEKEVEEEVKKAWGIVAACDGGKGSPSLAYQAHEPKTRV